MNLTNYSLQEIQGRALANPFPHVYLPNFFKPEIHEVLIRQFRTTLEQKLFYPLGKYDALGHVIQDGTAAGKLFYSQAWLDYVSKIFGLNLSGKTDASFHHHKVGSKSGWIHNDLHTVFIKDNKNADGVSPWRQDTDYWGGSCGTPGEKRVMTFIYFLDNDGWQDGDNGELGFYKDLSYESLFAKIPPINNSALFFKCSEKSYHAYIGDNKRERNSIIQFFLGEA